MQLSTADIDILREAAVRLVDAVNNLKLVTAETFVKANKRGEGNLRGNSDRTLIDLEIMLNRIETIDPSTLLSLAGGIGSMEWLRGSEGTYAADSRAGAEDTSGGRAYVIADRYIEIHQREE